MSCLAVDARCLAGTLQAQLSLEDVAAHQARAQFTLESLDGRPRFAFRVVARWIPFSPTVSDGWPAVCPGHPRRFVGVHSLPSMHFVLVALDLDYTALFGRLACALGTHLCFGQQLWL